MCLFNGTEALGSVSVESEAHIVMDPRSAPIFLTAMISPPPISLSGDLWLDPHIAPVCFTGRPVKPTRLNMATVEGSVCSFSSLKYNLDGFFFIVC